MTATGAAREAGMDQERGIYVKYDVCKVENGEPVFNCFVLRPDKDRNARAALLAYAESVKQENPTLAAELAAWVIESTP